MKKILLSLFAIAVYTYSFSQARITVTDYNKVQEPAVENEIMYPVKTVTKAI
ncbi:MAG: hypothetical protein HY305_05725, partial [Sphingobacteriales bacterium]|nr:hypothetical protein [Sphingobacteriales bacterium]